MMPAATITRDLEEIVLRALSDGHSVAEVASAAGFSMGDVVRIAGAVEEAKANARIRRNASKIDGEALQLGQEWARANLPYGVEGNFSIRFYREIDRYHVKRPRQHGRPVPAAIVPASADRPMGGPGPRGPRRAQGGGKCPLSARELESLQYLATGLQYNEIAVEMELSVSTIRTHLHNAYGRLGVRDRAQAVIFAAWAGWIDLSQDPRPTRSGAAVPLPRS